MAKKWTPEERAAQAAKMRDSHAARKAVADDLSAPPAADPNPIADETVPTATMTSIPSIPSAPPPSTPRAGRTTPTPARPAATPFDAAAFTSSLAAIPLDALSYADCGALLNALSAASTAIALRRRQAQEQTLAGTLRAPCATCSRPIDISKSGGFQILTERDEHWQPVNRYYCSQTCLLAKNMPSHRAKKLPGDAGAKA